MTPQERINELLSYTGLSAQAFANRIGCQTKQTIYDLQKGRTRDISYSVRNKILSCFPEINQNWLITGEGDMFNKSAITTRDITQTNNNSPNATNNVNVGGNNTQLVTHGEELKPLIPLPLSKEPNVDVYEVVKSNKVKNASYFNAFSAFASFDMYYEVKQDAMMPDYLPGDILALQAIPAGAKIPNGSPAIIDTKQVGFIFRLVYDRGTSYELKVKNHNSQYEDEFWDKSEIFRLYRVVGMVRIGM